MDIQFSYELNEEEYKEIFRTHLKFKFRLRRSMYMSLCLYLFGLIMQYGIAMDFAFLNTIVFWLLIFSISVNLFADYYLSKKAFLNSVSHKQHQGTLKINSTDISITQEKIETKLVWSKFTQFTESEYAFLLYVSDTLYLVPKKINKSNVDELRKFLKENVHS